MNDNKATKIFQKGIRRASEITGTSTRQASLKAGYNQNQLVRFLGNETDIKLRTLDDICEKGFGMTMENVFNLGNV